VGFRPVCCSSDINGWMECEHVLQLYDLHGIDTWAHCKINPEMQMAETGGWGPATLCGWKWSS
jgi:hypothetical protein